MLTLIDFMNMFQVLFDHDNMQSDEINNFFAKIAANDIEVHGHAKVLDKIEEVYDIEKMSMAVLELGTSLKILLQICQRI